MAGELSSLAGALRSFQRHSGLLFMLYDGPAQKFRYKYGSLMAMPDCGRISELNRLNVTVLSFPHLNRANDGFAEVTNRFMFKIIALLFSSFDEVLLLDSDNIILRDPEELFSSTPYLSTGSLLWLDFWGRSSAPDCQAILGNITAVLHTHESGQLITKKSNTWEALALALFMNAHSYFFFPLTINYMCVGSGRLTVQLQLSGISKKCSNWMGLKLRVINWRRALNAISIPGHFCCHGLVSFSTVTYFTKITFTTLHQGLGDKEIIAMAFLHLGMPYGLVRHGPDHVGVRDHDRSSVLGNTMLQHSPDGVLFISSCESWKTVCLGAK